MSFKNSLAEHIDTVKATDEVLSYDEYLDLVESKPRIAQLAPARMYGMIKSAGIEHYEENGVTKSHYKFFEDKIYGNDDVLERFVNNLKAASKRTETRKRILMLMGPPGSGKSTMVTALKRGLEDFTLTDDGRFYAIKYPEIKGSPYSGQVCPMREEPLHAIPHSLRADFPVYIEGDLCPLCRIVVDEDLNGDFRKLLVVRSTISEQRRRGIGAFQPSDPKSQDISELVGSLDLSTIGAYGSESDPRAYRFDGEANVANRGFLEGVELLKADEKFLYLFLSLTQEQNIKSGRFPNIYADEMIIAHTNEAEFEAWKADRKSEALRDRVIVISTPYNLKLNDEVKIYNKLIGETTILNSVHIDPLALESASFFAILTRLEEPKKAGYDKIKKLKLYNDEKIAGVKEKDVKELKDATDREGMDGLGPRYIINQLANALVRDKGAERKRCLTAIETLRALKEGLDTTPSISKERIAEYETYITEARREFDEKVKVMVQKGFVESFETNANELLRIYVDNVEAFCNKDKIKHAITGEEMEPDEILMRSIEEQIGITAVQVKSFREDILIKLGSYYRSGKEFGYDSHPRLKEAIEKKLFADLKDLVRVTTSTKTPDKEQLERMNQVAKRLMDEHGYCEVCANEVLQYVGSLLNR